MKCNQCGKTMTEREEIYNNPLCKICHDKILKENLKLNWPNGIGL